MKENTESFRNTTHLKKIRASEEFYGGENYFDRLPTEVIISIFERILDAKCLCICSSVSKYFSAHVLQTRFVSVEIPYTVGQSAGRVVVWPPGVKNFLQKLCCVESATIKFALPNSSPSSGRQISKPSVWWKSNPYAFILVAAESRVASSDDGITSNNASPRFIKEIINNLRDFMSRFYYVKELHVLLPKLKNISAADSMKQGSIVWEEGIAGMKKGKPLDDRGEFCGKSRTARVVKLPLSGCVTKDLTLILKREIGACDGFIAENLLEENEYREVAMSMMKDYESRDSSAVRGTIAEGPYMSLLLLMAGQDFYTKFIDTIRNKCI